LHVSVFYSRVFSIFLPNIIKIDPYNLKIYRFKVGSFFETQYSIVVLIATVLRLSVVCQYLYGMYCG